MFLALFGSVEVTDYDLAISRDGRISYHLSGEQLALRDARTLQPFHYNHAPFTFEIPHRLHRILPARRSIAISNSGTSLYMLNYTVPQVKRTWAWPHSTRRRFFDPKVKVAQRRPPRPWMVV